MFVQSIGTTASLRGAATSLKRHNPALRVVAVEPAESAVLSGGRPGAHRIEGIRIGYVPPMWDPDLPDEIVPIATADAEDMARRLAREEGLFAGTSSGATVLAAIQVGRRLGPTARVATLLVDSGLKYLSTRPSGVGRRHLTGVVGHLQDMSWFGSLPCTRKLVVVFSAHALSPTT